MPTDDKLTELFQKAEIAANGDAERAGLGLETRVMAAIRHLEQATVNPIDAWASAFFRGAWVTTIIVAGIAIWTWQSADLGGLEGNLAFSAMVDAKSELEFFPSKLEIPR